MRGTPFLKEGFHLGLNTIDSPYTLKEGETRDCLNVVSTERGAIRKRTGLLTFASGATAYFPTLAATDTFERANEKPLTKDGKGNEAAWKEIAALSVVTGEIETNHWQPGVAGGAKTAAAYYSVAEQSNPAVDVELIEVQAAEDNVAVLASIDATIKKWYEVKAVQSAKLGEYTVTIVKENAGVPTTLATIASITFAAKDRLGISVRAGNVTAWRYNNALATWFSLGSVADASYNKGFTGFRGQYVSTPKPLRLNNFATGEITAPSTEAEFTSLLPCMIGGTSYLVAASGTKLFSITTKGEITEIGSGFTEGKRWSIIQGPKNEKPGEAKPLQKEGGPVYLSNGTDPPCSWTGAAKNTLVTEWEGQAGEYEDGQSTEKVKGYEVGVTTKIVAGKPKVEAEFKAHVPRGKFMAINLGVIFMAGYAEDEYAVRWCGQAKLGIGGTEPDPTSWPQSNVIRFDPEDGKPITGLGTVGPYVLVFKEHKMWVIHSLTVTGYRRLSDKVGTTAYRSIVETQDGTYFLTHDAGVWLTNGSTVREISYSIRPTLTSKANGEKLELAAGGYLNNHYYVSFPKEGQEKNSHTADYDVVLKSWWLHDFAANQWVAWELAEEAKLYVVRPKTKDGVLKAFNPGVYQDAGVNYTGDGKLGAYWRSHWETFAYYIFRHRVKAPFLKKRLRMIFFDGTGSVIPVHYKNFATTGEELNTVLTNASEAAPTKPTELGSEAKTARAYALGTINTVSIAFGNNSAEPFEVTSYAWMISFRKS